MKIEVQVVVAFTVTAALTAAASYPAIARAASVGAPFRSYSGHQCKGLGVAYTTAGAHLGNPGVQNLGLTTAFCPLVNDTSLPLNGATAPTVHLNGTFTVVSTSEQILAFACSLNATSGDDMRCGTGVPAPASGTTPQVTVDTTAWENRANDDGFFLYVNTSPVLGNGPNQAELWSYDSE
jgi:hypothetical protein